jgi:hypothetical protein
MNFNGEAKSIFMEIAHSSELPMPELMENCGIDYKAYLRRINENADYEIPFSWVINLTIYTKNYSLIFWMIKQVGGVYLPPGLKKSLNNIRGLLEDLWKMMEERKEQER